MLDAPDGGGYIRPCDPRRPSPTLPWWISRCATGAVCASPSARPKRFTSRSPTWSSIGARAPAAANASPPAPIDDQVGERSEEHTSELQSPCNLVCRLLLEKKKNKNDRHVNRNAQQLDTHVL